MASIDRMIVARRGDYNAVRLRTSAVITVTMAAGVTVSGSFTPPEGSRVSAMKSFTPTAITGSPTNINLTVGKTAGGTEYVSTVDKKAANSADALTLVAAADYASWPASQAIIVQIAAVGGTNPAGTISVEIEYSAPNP